MKYAIWLLALAACQARGPMKSTRAAGAPDLTTLVPRDSADSALLLPRVITAPSVVLFWLAAADTLGTDDQSQALDDLRSSTDQVARVLQANDITLVATNADTVYIALPHHKRRAVLLSGLDYPFGYLLVDPGAPERILTGIYADDELLEELRAYFDLQEDSLPARPRVST